MCNLLALVIVSGKNIWFSNLMQATWPAHSRDLSIRTEVDKKIKPGTFLVLRNVLRLFHSFQVSSKTRGDGREGYQRISEYRCGRCTEYNFQENRRRIRKDWLQCSDKNDDKAEIFEYFAVQLSFRTTIRSLKVTRVLCTYPC